MKPGPKPKHVGCKVEGCDRPHSGRGYCKLHYGRWFRHGNPHRSNRPGMKTRGRVLQPRVLDVLDADGGWLTTAGIHLLVADVAEDSVRATLVRLVDAGLVVHRRVELSVKTGRRGNDYRDEWRLV